MRKEIYVYISGKIGNGRMPDPQRMADVTLKFEKAESIIRSLGYIPINPLKLGFTNGMTYNEVLNKCIELIREKANAIFLLQDWSESFGATSELKEAEKKGLSIYRESNNGYQHLDNDAVFIYKIQEELPCN